MIGKTVILFCTAASSGIGKRSLLEEMAGTGNWQEGEQSGSSDADIRNGLTDWIYRIETLGKIRKTPVVNEFNSV